MASLVYYVTYQDIDGKIVDTGIVDANLISSKSGVDQTSIQSSGLLTDSTHYVDTSGPTVTLKVSLGTVASWDKTQIKMNGVDSATLSSLPVDSFIDVTTTQGGFIDVVNKPIGDGSFVFTTTVSGQYQINAGSFPYLDYTTTIEDQQVSYIDTKAITLTLLDVVVNQGETVSVDTKVLSITTNDIVIAHIIDIDTYSFNITPQDVTLMYNEEIAVDTATLTVTTNDITLDQPSTVSVDTLQLTVTLNSVTI